MSAANRKYEFLKLCLIPEADAGGQGEERSDACPCQSHSEQTDRVEVQNDARGFQNTNKSKANLLDYLENIRKKSVERGSTNHCLRTVSNTIRELKPSRGDYIAFRRCR